MKRQGWSRAAPEPLGGPGGVTVACLRVEAVGKERAGQVQGIVWR